jgi:GNAT superfamily N-acetyltransferase
MTSTHDIALDAPAAAAPQTALRFGADYWEELDLDDGTRVRLFPMSAQHAGCLARGYEALSPRSRYLRFLSGAVRLTPRAIDYLTDVDGERHFALGAQVLQPSGAVAGGVGRIVQTRRDPESVEAAITVIDAYQRCGLGTALATRLVEAARERGYRQLQAEVLAENRGILRLLRRAPHPMSLTRFGASIEARMRL